MNLHKNKGITHSNLWNFSKVLFANFECGEKIGETISLGGEKELFPTVYLFIAGCELSSKSLWDVGLWIWILEDTKLNSYFIKTDNCDWIIILPQRTTKSETFFTTIVLFCIQQIRTNSIGFGHFQTTIFRNLCQF